MNEKEIISGNKMAWNIIGWAILYGFLFGIVYSFTFNLLTSNLDNEVLTGVIYIVLQSLVAYFTWKASISTAFRKKTINYSAVSSVIKGIIIYTIIILILYSISITIESNSKLEEVSNSVFSIYDFYAEYYLEDSDFIAYQQQKQDMIDEVQSQINSLIVTFIVANVIIYSIMIFASKKMVLKYVQPENDVIIQ